MNGWYERVILEPLGTLSETLLRFLPNLLAAVIVAVAGIVAGGVVRTLTRRLLQALRIDRHSEGMGLHELLKRGGVGQPLSTLIATILGWMTLFLFLVVSLSILNIPAVERVLERLLLYLPNLFLAAVVVVLGVGLGNFLGRAALIAAVNAGVRLSRPLSLGVRLSIIVLAVSMALEQLGIGKETVVSAFQILFGGAVLALAIAFGLGGRHLARRWLERRVEPGEGGPPGGDGISHL